MGHSKLDIMMHPVRMRILTLLGGNRQATASQLAEALPDVAQATLYRHIRALADNDLIAVIEERPIRGTVEKVYAIPELDAINVSADEFNQLSKEEQLRHFTTFMTTLLGQYERYLAHTDKPDASSDGVGYQTRPLYLSEEELQTFSQQLHDLLRPLMAHEPSPERKRRLLTTILLPDIDDLKPEEDHAND